MGNNQTEKAFEEKRLAQTISLAEETLGKVLCQIIQG